MKTIICLLSLMTSLSLTRAQETSSDSDYQETAVSYAVPVVYQAPVIYQVPVVYYAPVYYMASAATAACYPSCERVGPSPSTVIHLTNGRGTYVTSNRGNCGSTVVYIGGRYARR